MTTHLTLIEAASILGVSKETLRNWDKSGKLKSVRHPSNNYRMYLLQDIQAIAPIKEIPEKETSLTISSTDTSEIRSTENQRNADKDVRKALAKLHKALRDTDGNSSIIERFDEVTKLLFLKLMVEQNRDENTLFSSRNAESHAAYALRIRRAFNHIAKENDQLFPEKFRELHLSDAAIVTTGVVLADLTLTGNASDVKGYAYEEMIRNTFDKGDHQQFFTPSSIVEFMVGLVELQLSKVVADPACGTGGFLVEVAKKNIPNIELLGLEIDERLAWVAGVNFFVHGAKKFHTHCLPNGGTLGPSGRKFSKKVDVILTNPPFGSDYTDRNELETYILGRGKSNRRRGILFLERCLDLLKNGGWLAIVIDEGVLSLPSASDVRNLILSQAELHAVINLPESTFMPYASVNTSILLLRKKTRSQVNLLTFYARAENVGRKPNGELDVVYDETGASTLNNDLPEILAKWRAFRKNGVLEHQTDNMFLANPITTLSALAPSDNRIDFRYHHPARVAAQTAVERCEFPLTKLGDLCHVRNENYVPSVDFPDQIIAYTGLAHIDPYLGTAHQASTPANSLSSGVKKYYRGDILFAKMRPNLRKVAYIDFENSGYSSAECIVLSVNKQDDEFLIDPFALSILLRSDFIYGQIIHLIAGIGRPRITVKDLLNVKIPIPSKTRQLDILKAFSATKIQYERIRHEAHQLELAAAQMEVQAINSVANSFVAKGKK